MRVYRGAELDGKTTESSLEQRLQEAIIVNGLSKAYGLPGLRIGWIVHSPGSRLEHGRATTTHHRPSARPIISPRSRLDPHVRDKLIERTRRILHCELSGDEAWLKTFGDTFAGTRPRAGAIWLGALPRRDPALDVVEKLRAQHSVLPLPRRSLRHAPDSCGLASAASCSISRRRWRKRNVDCVDCSVTD